jgi:putative membrane protein
MRELTRNVAGVRGGAVDRGLCPTQAGGQPRITLPAAKPNNVNAQCAVAEETLRFSNYNEEIRMRKLMAMIALVAPLTAAPLAFGADDPDATFYKKAAESGIFEVDAGNQAQQKAKAQAVKDFGAMMVKDHTAANDQLKTLAASKNVSLPTSASVGEIAEKGKLDVLTGDTYDKSYITGQIKAHHEAIALFKKEIASGQDADAKAFAQATLPTLQHHLKSAQAIAAQNGWTKPKASS